MLQTVLPPLTSRGGSGEIQTVTARLQTLGPMKPTSVIQQKLSQEKSKREARTCRMERDIPSDFHETIH